MKTAILNGGYAELYANVRQAEAKNKENLLEYQKEKPGVIEEDNVYDVIVALRKRKENQ